MAALSLVRPVEGRVVQPATRDAVIECVVKVATGTARTFYCGDGKAFSHKRSEAHKFSTFAEANDYAYANLLPRNDVLDVAFLVGSV